MRHYKSSTQKSNRYLIPSILAMGFIPLIVHRYLYDSKLSDFIWFPAEKGIQSDFFLAWKMIAIIITSISMVCLLLNRYHKKQTVPPFDNSFYLLFFYALLVLMSALFSHYKYWVFSGSYGNFESVLVIFGYMIFCFYTYTCIQNEEQIKYLLTWSGIGFLIVTGIGVFQYLGLDLFGTTFGKMLITSPSYWSELQNIEFRVGANTAYSTLYNQNYLSFYYGLLIPFLACLIIGCKKNGIRVLLLSVEFAFVICMIGCKSASGWLAIGIATILIIFILSSRKKKACIVTGFSAIAIIIGGVVLCLTTSIGQKISGIFIGTEKLSQVFSLHSIETKDDEVVLNIRDNELHLTYSLDENSGIVTLFCKDENGVELCRSASKDNELVEIIDDISYMGCSVSPVMYEDTLAIDVNLEGTDWYFTKETDGTYYYINPVGKLEKYTTPKNLEIFGHDAMSGRGQIWNNTLTILGKYVLFGSGANTYIFAYPQNDYIYRAYLNIQNNYDVKAHCWYLQQWVDNGMLSLLCLLGFLIWYVVRCIKIYRKADLHDSLSWTGIGIFAGTLTYMFVALANDSNVCTAPVFWVMLGLGMAVNRIIVEKYSLFQESIEKTKNVISPARHSSPKATNKKQFHKKS